MFRIKLFNSANIVMDEVSAEPSDIREVIADWLTDNPDGHAEVTADE